MRAPPPRRALFGLVVAALLLFLLFPVYWAVVTSLKSGSALFELDYLPPRPAWDNYAGVFAEQAFGLNILNSLIVACTTVAAALALGLFAAYSLSRVDFHGRRLLLYCILGVSMFPQIAVLTGMFELINRLGIYKRLYDLQFADVAQE